MDERSLNELSLFSGLGKRERKHVAPMVEEVDVEAGSQLIEQGDIAHELFVIQEGTAAVTRDGSQVRQLGPGDFFGEIALHDEERRRTSTVVATSPMRLAVLHSRHMRVLEREMPDFARELNEALEQRLAADESG
jgi:CRP/FNR family cyclic AMP-dependent transcriptional regulator